MSDRLDALDRSGDRPFLSVVIPAHNEEASLRQTVEAITSVFSQRLVDDFEIIVVDDNSTDGTAKLLGELQSHCPQLSVIQNPPPHGFGFAVRRGLDTFRGEAVCVMMADLSDSPTDLLAYYDALKGGAECVFGSRFIAGSQIVGYPRLKMFVNRMANWFVKILFRLNHNDITNAFKAYRREVIDGIRPLLSHHFNLTVEMPLKAIVRGYTFETLPISWHNRKHGISKLQMKEMGSRYLFIVLYVFLERLLSKGDYRRRDGN